LILLIAGAISAAIATIFLLMSLVTFISLGLQAAGLSPFLSVALGAIIIFLLLGVSAFLLMRKGTAGLPESLLPEKTLETLGVVPKLGSDSERKNPRSVEELQKQVEERQAALAEDLEILKEDLKPRHIVTQSFQHHPRRLFFAGAIATLTTLNILKTAFKRASKS
jgi:hypothetical protein